MDEVIDNKDCLVDPLDFENMAKRIDKILKDKKLREKIIEKGIENVKRFSWEKSGKEVSEVLMKK